MKIKSYFANSVEAAIKQAHEELGSDAMLIESRAPSADMRRLGRFEVVIGVPDGGREQSRAQPFAAPPAREELASELKMLRGQINDLRKMLQPSPVSPEVEQVQQELIAADIDATIAENFIQSAEVIWQDAIPPSASSTVRKECLRQIVRECVRTRVQAANDLNGSAGKGNVVTFVGPPGAGKSTAIAKIAVQHCLAKRRSVRIVSVDADRVGSHELLRTYCNLMGIGFIAASSLADIQDALDQSQEKNFVLIDTPGFAPADMDAAHDLAAFLGRLGGREVHLVLPASMKRADLAEYSRHFEMFKPSRLLFTKLDETASVGSVLTESLRLGIPLSFFSMGQSVPEDLENADPEVLIGRLFPPAAASAANAA